ncbi:DUF2742 domain-containing protein [Mycobacterium colombiense]
MAGPECVKPNRPIQPQTTPHITTTSGSRTANATRTQPLSSSQRHWFPVYKFVQLLLDNASIDVETLEPAGTLDWIALDDSDPRKLLSCALEGVHRTLRLDTEQEKLAAASRDISGAADWGQVAREYIARQRFRANHPEATRVVVS